MDKQTRATLEILISEIKDILNETVEPTTTLEEIEGLIDSWVNANDLHPEKCIKVSSIEELERQLGIRIKRN